MLQVIRIELTWYLGVLQNESFPLPQRKINSNWCRISKKLIERVQVVGEWEELRYQRIVNI